MVEVRRAAQGRGKDGGVVALSQPMLLVGGLICHPDGGEQGCLGNSRPTVPPSHLLPQPLSKGRKPKALTQKPWLVSPRNNSITLEASGPLFWLG